MAPAAFLGLCLLGCLALPGAQANKCPRGWLDWGGHCYGYFGQELPWRKAEARCRAARGGGHLASLHTPEEHRALAAFIAQRREEEEEEEEENVWIGLYHWSQAWTWADGSGQRYSAWGGDDSPRGQRCGALEDSSGFMSWRTIPAARGNPSSANTQPKGGGPAGEPPPPLHPKPHIPPASRPTPRTPLHRARAQP